MNGDQEDPRNFASMQDEQAGIETPAPPEQSDSLRGDIVKSYLCLTCNMEKVHEYIAEDLRISLAKRLNGEDDAEKGRKGVTMRTFKNAKAVIEQIRNGEWEFLYNPLSQKHCRAEREGRVLWISNGSWYCDVDDCNAFGLLFRHWVWWAAARKATKEANGKYSKPKPKRELKLYSD